MHRFKTCNDFREARIPCVTPCSGHRNETSTPKGQQAQLQYPSGDNVRSPRGTLLAKPLISSRRQRPLPPYRRWCLMRRHCPRPRRPYFSAVRVGLASVSRFFGLLGGDGGFGLLRLWGVPPHAASRDVKAKIEARHGHTASISCLFYRGNRAIYPEPSSAPIAERGHVQSCRARGPRRTALRFGGSELILENLQRGQRPRPLRR